MQTGDVKIDQADKPEVVLINDFNPQKASIEGVVTHELLHIKLWGMDQMIECLIHSLYDNDESGPKFSFAYARFMESEHRLKLRLLSGVGRG